jgi:hypothetical protein
VMQRRTPGRAGVLMPTQTPPSRLKAGAPSGRHDGEPAGIASAGFPLECRAKPLLVRTIMEGHLRVVPVLPGNPPRQ